MTAVQTGAYGLKVNKEKNRGGLALIAALMLSGVSITPALAGFDWTPPEQQLVPTESQSGSTNTTAGPLTPEPDAVPAVPVEAVENAESVTPTLPVPAAEVPAESVAVESKPEVKPETKPEEKTTSEIIWAERPDETPEIPAQSAEGETPKETEEAPVATAEMPTPAPEAGPVLEGFGKDIPLPIALRQVVPARYAFHFASDVQVGQKVSWEGGKPWREVLDAMLSPVGLAAAVTANVVSINAVGEPQAASDSQPGYSKSATSLMEPPETAVTLKDDVIETPEVTEAAPAQQEQQPAVPATAKEETKDSSSAPPAAEEDTVQPSLGAQELEKQETAQTDAAPAGAASPSPASQPALAEPTTTTTPDTVPVVDVKNRRRWEAQPGTTLRETLEVWGKTAGTEVEWMTPYDYPVDSAFSFQGPFDQAVEAILSLYAKEEQRPRGRLYPNLPDGPSVLMIN